MRNPLLAPELRELLQEGRTEDLVQVLQDLHPHDAAAILSALETDEIVQVFSLLPLELERDLFRYLDPEVQEHIVLGAGRQRVADLLASLPSDDRAEFLEGLDERVRDQLVPLLPNAAREDLLRRQRFEDDQVGAILSTDYCVLNPLLTADQAIKELRRQAPRKDTIYYSYVVDRQGKLIGFVSLRDLITAPDDQRVQDIMRTDVVAVTPETDQEKAAQLIRDYDLIALPVVDEAGRLVGIVTHDDAVDIVEEEDTEDIEKMAGVTGEAEGDGFLQETLWSQFRRRAPVISLMAGLWFVTASVIKAFEEHIAGTPALVLALLPMVMATGGMVGTQSSTLTIRALTTGNLEPGKLGHVLWKEMRVSLALAFVLSSIVFVQAVLLGWGDDKIQGPGMLLYYGFTLALALAIHVTAAGVLGAMIPVLAKRLGGDPAMISTPAVTVIADLTGACFYMGTVALMVGIS